MDDHREGLVIRAQELRESLREEGLSFEEKRARYAAVKRETYDLLQEAHLPHPLCALVADLWGGYEGFVERVSPAFVVAAGIEGRHPAGRIGRNELARQLAEQLREMKAAGRLPADFDTEKDFRHQITRWRKDRTYRRIVSQSRGE